MGKILLVDDDSRLVNAFSHILTRRGHSVVATGTAEEGLALLENEAPEIVVLDIHLPGGSGLDAFKQIKERGYQAPVIVMTGESTMQNAVEAMALGAYSYQLKPFEPEEMLKTIEQGLEDFRIRQEIGADHELPDQPVSGTIIGRSPAMQEVYKSIGRVAPTDATVMIRGESGTGKELVARFIHDYSRRSTAPFVAVNCLAIPESLLESELFGHEKGAFTGADARRIGRFEQARGGTLFLDEIGDIPPSVQGKILRVLQERVFHRVGGEQILNADVRVMTATSRNVEQAVRDGQFRDDLLYRLNVVTIRLPPLRERPDDIPALVDAFVRRFAAELQIDAPKVSSEALAVLSAYRWPGNVRELEHCVCRALVFQRGAVLHPEHIKTALGMDQDQDGGNASLRTEQLRDAVHGHLLTHGGGKAFDSLSDQVESLLLHEALRLAGGNQARAARLLGLPRQTFRAKLSRHPADHDSPSE